MNGKMVLELILELKDVVPQTAKVELLDGGTPVLRYDPVLNVVFLCPK